MASPLDRKVIFGLLYLWIRDAQLALTSKTARYINGHCRSLLDSEEVEYSDKEIIAFIEEKRLVPKLVHHLRMDRPKARRGLTRSQRDSLYGRRHPRARVTVLDREQ